MIMKNSFIHPKAHVIGLKFVYGYDLKKDLGNNLIFKVLHNKTL